MPTNQAWPSDTKCPQDGWSLWPVGYMPKYGGGFSTVNRRGGPNLWYCELCGLWLNEAPSHVEAGHAADGQFHKAIVVPQQLALPIG